MKMIGQELVTKQTGSVGKICNSVIVTERKFSRREFYFAFALEREFNGPVLIASRYGGVNIEEVAADISDGIIYRPIDHCTGLTKEMAEWIVRRVGICEQSAATVKMLCNLYDLFMKKDVLLAEINPYIEDVCLNYYALDAKLKFDDSAEFRQSEIFARRDTSQEDPKEVAASSMGMNYIALDGNIGCMVNGAGLAMATCDILKIHDGIPANFLDVGGMASVDAVKKAVEVIMMDKKVRTIFVNIYGGIVHCDIVVEGLLKAIKEFDVKVPVVVRLQGNNLLKAQKMIRQAKTNIITRDDFTEAAEMAVRCSKIMELAEGGDLEATLSMKVTCDCEPIAPAPKFPPCPPLVGNDSVKTKNKPGVIFMEVKKSESKAEPPKMILKTPDGKKSEGKKVDTKPTGKDFYKPDVASPNELKKPEVKSWAPIDFNKSKTTPPSVSKKPEPDVKKVVQDPKESAKVTVKPMKSDGQKATNDPKKPDDKPDDKKKDTTGGTIIIK